MKINKYSYIRIIVTVVFFVLIIFANQIVLYIDSINNQNLSNITEFNIDIDSINKDKVYYHIDSIVNYDNMMKYIALKGWSFVETEQSADNRTVYLVLKSADREYAINGILHNREIFAKFKEKKINGIKHGFVFQFSTLHLKNDIYKIYLFTKENTENYGIVDTNKIIVINNGSAVVKDFINKSTQVDITGEKIVNNIRYSIDKVYKEDNLLQVSGWAYIKSDNKTGDIYIGIKNRNSNEQFFATNKIIRDDVGQHFQNKLLSNSGFNAAIPINDNQIDNISSIVIKVDDKYYIKQLGNTER